MIKQLSITPEQAKEWSLKGIKVRIENLLYEMKLDTKVLQVGDRVLDMRDGTHGVVDLIQRNGKIAVRDGNVIEGNIEPERLIKLSPIQQATI